LNGLDASAAAANAPAVADKARMAPLNDPSKNQKRVDNTIGRWPQTFSYGGGAPGEGLSNKYDPSRPFFYIDEDGMAVIGLAALGPTEQPEAGDPFVATDLAGESNEADKKADEDKKNKTKEPDDKSSTTKPVKDAKQMAPTSTSNGPVKVYLNGKPAPNAKGYPAAQFFSNGTNQRATFYYSNPQ
jgi:hypothetical protein